MVQSPKKAAGQLLKVIQLDNDNWITYKRQLLCALDRQALRGVLTGSDVRPLVCLTCHSPTSEVASVELASPSPSPIESSSSDYNRRLVEWEERNGETYFQIISTVSPRLQLLLRGTTDAFAAWQILLDHFESEDPSKVDSMLAKYDSCQRKSNQSMSSFISQLNELRSQLALLGETIPDSVHAAKILKNLPETLWTVMALVKAGDSGSTYLSSPQRLRSRAF